MPDDRIASYHEAGHVLAAHALGLPISTVELTDAGGEFRPFARESWEPTTPEGMKQLRDAVLASLGPQHIEEMFPTMVGLLAGLAAQRRLVGRTHDSYANADMEQVKAIAREVTDSPLAARNLIAHATDQSDHIVAQRWAAIVALAGELLLRRRLDAGQIMDVITLGPSARRRKAWDAIAAQTTGQIGRAHV
jgi:hypothetical protein